MSTYTVKPGDTLSKIAVAHGTTIADILAANRIPDPDLIHRGQRLTIPGVLEPDTGEASPQEMFEVVHVVRKGETLRGIASANGVSLAELVKHNPEIKNPDLVTIGQLINVPSGIEAVSGVVARVELPDEVPGEQKWLSFARNELETDVAEVRGNRHNPRILEYHATTSLRANRDETPWCSSFVNWCITQAGMRGTNRANARSWLDWGVPLTEPKVGAVAVFWRGSSNDRVSGHVGFFIEDNGSTIQLLGGNQANRVSIKNQSMKKFLGYRYPKDL